MAENMSGSFEEDRAQLRRNVENFKRKIWESMSDAAREEALKSEPKLTSFELNAAGEYVSPITRLEREIDELKKDKAAKDAMIKELQERLNKLEAAQNLLN